MRESEIKREREREREIMREKGREREREREREKKREREMHQRYTDSCHIKPAKASFSTSSGFLLPVLHRLITPD